MTKLTFGRGQVKVQPGHIQGEGRCLSFDRLVECRPIGSTQKDGTWEAQSKQDDHDVLIVFENLESARVLQDQLNGLCADWAKELSIKV